MKRQLTLLVVILCGFILVQACGESPTPTQECVSESPTPTPECVNENWSYTDQATTQIEITPALKITIKDYELKFEVVLIVNPDGTSETVGPAGPITRRITIYGDGRAVFERESDEAPLSSEVQISADQLNKIVTVLEEANFFAIWGGCEGKQQVSCCAAHYLHISVETEDQTHEISDHGNCSDGQYFSAFCGLPAKIESILGTVDAVLGPLEP